MIALCVLAIGVVLIPVFAYYVSVWTRGWRFRSQAVSTVREITSYEQAAERGLGMGVLLGDPDHWIAIAYRDSHRGGIVSVAIARTSDGLWYESDRHFCGGLVAYRSRREDLTWITKLVADNQLGPARQMAEDYIDLRPDEPIPGPDELMKGYHEASATDLSRTLWMLEDERDASEQQRLFEQLGFRRISEPK